MIVATDVTGMPVKVGDWVWLLEAPENDARWERVTDDALVQVLSVDWGRTARTVILTHSGWFDDDLGRWWLRLDGDDEWGVMVEQDEEVIGRCRQRIAPGCPSESGTG